MGKLEQPDFGIQRLLEMSKAITFIADKALDGSVDLAADHRQALERCDLNRPQQRKLEGIVARLGKAQRIISHLAERYEVRPSGVIRDKRGLYQAMYNDFPSGPFSARPQSFVMVFYVIPEDMHSDSAGLTMSSEILDDLLDYNIGQIRKRSPQYCSLDVLAAKISHHELDAKNGQVREYVGHETGHVFSNILNPRLLPYFSEITAELFARADLSARDKRHAIAEAKELHKDWAAVHKRMRKSTHLAARSEMNKQYGKGYGDVSKCLASLPLSRFRNVLETGLDSRVLGVAITLVPYQQAETQLRRMTRYLQEHPEEATYEKPR
ncbi:hypothetical protein HYU19_01555 [Candidatus Woesearchaeota archaeon]|nr:hypothetical protein [Candidatus Woesearchaeota archaeon]